MEIFSNIINPIKFLKKNKFHFISISIICFISLSLIIIIAWGFELLRSSYALGLKWGSSPSVSTIFIRCIEINTVSLAPMYIRLYLKEFNLIKSNIVTHLRITNAFLLLCCWIFLIWEYFQIPTPEIIGQVLNLLRVACVFIYFYWIFGIFKIFQGIDANLYNHKQLLDDLYQQSITDSLTDLPNRNAFYNNLDEKIKLDEANKLTILFLDVNRFKIVNDTFGHSAGDTLLRSITERLIKLTNDHTLLYRLGGDEFCFILDTSLECLDFIKKIFVCLDAPFLINDNYVYITSSLGIARYPEDGDTTEELLKNAEIAMYKAKEKGGNYYDFFKAEPIETSIEKLSIENDLYNALKNNEFILHYQPIYSFYPNEISGFEVLIRWIHPKKGLISPGAFIPIAEDNGLIIPIGKWILKSACKQFKSFLERVNPNLKLYVNISTKQLQHLSFSKIILEILEDTNFTPSNLELEITETSIMNDLADNIDKLLELKKIGINIALDDFGVGYSSLNYLRQLPINTLKIDKSFIDNIPENENNSTITKAMIQLGHNLGLEIVAEGVETLDQVEFLTTNKCDKFQGFLFSKPLPLEKTKALFP